MRKNLGDDKKSVLLDNNKCILRLVWKKNISNYLQGVRGYGLAAIKNRDIRYKKKSKNLLFKLN